LSRSCSGLQNAAGVLRYVKEVVLPAIALSAEDKDPPSPDLSPQTLDALIGFCLAQAQEFYFQQAIAAHSKNGVIARVALKVSEFYAEALTQANVARGAGGVWPTFAFPQAWINHVSYKKAHFAAVAQYRKSMDDSAANRYGDELGRLHLAQKLVKQGLETSKKGVAQSVVVDIRSLQVILADLITRAERDNSLIYLQAVTSEASLAPILSTALVKPTLPPDVEYPIPKLHTGRDGLGMRPLFERLLPYAVHLAISIYEDRKENFIKEEVAARREELDLAATEYALLQ
jgi:programmed cell death 6-interacting protein